MPARLDAMVERHLGRWPRVAQLFKYSAASVAGVVTSQVVLLSCVLVIGIDAAPSNVIAVTAGAVPNYLINRAWTFNKQGAHSLTREVLPFWGMALLGLLLSTFTVSWADTRFDGNPLALSAANIGAFGVLWVAKFIVLDRVLFAPLAELVEHHEDDEGHLHLRADGTRTEHHEGTARDPADERTT